jgi:hypothetical protein
MHAMAAPAAPVPAPEKALGDGARAASYSSNKMDSLLHGGIMALGYCQRVHACAFTGNSGGMCALMVSKRAGWRQRQWQ